MNVAVGPELHGRGLGRSVCLGPLELPIQLDLEGHDVEWRDELEQTIVVVTDQVGGDSLCRGLQIHCGVDPGRGAHLRSANEPLNPTWTSLNTVTKPSPPTKFAAVVQPKMANQVE